MKRSRSNFSNLSYLTSTQSYAYSEPAPTWGTVGAAHKKCFEGPQPIKRVGAPIAAIGAGFEAIKTDLLFSDVPCVHGCCYQIQLVEI